MSMTQEEIEALMNGIDASEDAAPETQEQEDESSNETMSEDDIENLIAQTQTAQAEESPAEEEVPAEEESVDDILASFENEQNDEAEVPEEDINIDDMLADIDGVTDDTQDTGEEDANFDDILAGIDGVVDDTPAVEEKPAGQNGNKDEEEIAKNWTDKQIKSGIFPLPVEKNTKVVGQLSEVASDSEEKATKIFDVMSFILDENNEVQKNVKAIDEFLAAQISMLESLTIKFPNIELFKTNLETAKSLKQAPKDILSKIDAENMQLFEAMELMQFHDINRQKIERVMSVIRRLSDYLNGLFEDDQQYQDVSVAKHIHGDDNTELVGNDDLEALIAEFGN